MIYRKKFKTEEEWKEVSYEDALWTVLGAYKDTPVVRSMLTIGNYIPCQYSDIRVLTDDGKTAMPGLWCVIPEEYADSLTEGTFCPKC